MYWLLPEIDRFFQSVFLEGNWNKLEIVNNHFTFCKTERNCQLSQFHSILKS